MRYRVLPLSQSRAWFAALCCALLLAACGGGGGSAGSGDAAIDPALAALEGDWQVTLSTAGGPTTAAAAIDAEDVPVEASDLEVADVARIIAATQFQAYATAVSGSTLRVTDPDTDYLMVINGITVSAFEGCGSCNPGSQVRVDLTVNFSESGVFDGLAVPARTTSVLLTLRFTRVS